MTAFQIWTICWQVAVFLTPLLLGVAVLWLKSQFVTKADAITERNRVDASITAVRQDLKTETNRLDGALVQQKGERDSRYESVKDRLADHEGRIKAAETEHASPPTRHSLSNSIATMQGGLHSVGKSVDGLRDQMNAQSADLRRQMETLNGYLHAIIEKHIQ